MINEAPDDIAFHFCGAQTASVTQGEGDDAKVGGAPSPLHAARPAPRGNHGKLGERGAFLHP